jgi:hypothetical protein
MQQGIELVLDFGVESKLGVFTLMQEVLMLLLASLLEFDVISDIDRV